MKLNFSTSAKTFWKVTTYVYGHLEAENLVRVRHSGAGKQSLQYPQHMALDLSPGQNQLRWPTPDVSSLIFWVPDTLISV